MTTGPLSPRRDSWCVGVGLAGLVVWLAGGLLLEALHGFKAVLYLQDGLRREMWTLAHAHGTLLAAICLLLALFVPRLSLAPALERRVDRMFAAGAVALPLGFWLGGLVHSESDPGLGILLVPVGATLALAALVQLAWSWWRLPRAGRP